MTKSVRLTVFGYYLSQLHFGSPVLSMQNLYGSIICWLYF